MATQLTDGTTNNVVDATSKGILVQNPRVPSQAGYVGLVGVNDTGSVVAGGDVNSVYVTQGEASGGIYAAAKNLLWDDTFNSTAQNTSKYKFAFTTMTATMSGGFLNMNSGSIVTVSTSCGFQSWKSFPLFAKAELRINISAQIPNGAQANQTIEYGLFQATLNGAAPGAPTDGVFYRWDPSGNLRGVINYNGVETQTGTITPPSTSVNHDWLIIVNTNVVQFYIDGILNGTIAITTAAPTQGQPFMAAAMPMTFRVFNASSGPSLAPILKVSDVFVAEMGPDLARPWPQQKAGFGHMGYQGQNGGVMGSTSNYGNGALAAATALSNTAVSTGNPAGLGGYSHDSCTLAAGTDGIMTSYQNPAGGVNQTPRNLIVTGVHIHSVIDSAITGGPCAFAYSVAFGHTAVSLATAESGSFVTGTAKAPRRILVGCEGFAANSVGTLGSPAGIHATFQSPIVVAPGEFFAITCRQLGVVASAGSCVHLVGVDAYFE